MIKTDKRQLKVLCLTRKYPPQVGGMESFSYHLLTSLNVDKKIIALGRVQGHLLWFIPYCIIYTLLTLKKWDVIYLGDSMMCIIGYLTKIFAPHKPVVVNVYGLDITYDNKVYQKYLNWCYSKLDRYICISRYTQQILANRSITQSVVIPCGVEVDSFYTKTTPEEKAAFKRKYNIPQDHTVAITVGRLIKRKGVLWCLNHVMPKLKSENITYLIIGNGEGKHGVVKAIEENGLEGSVRYLGRLPDEDMRYIYRNADVFVMPNIHVENDVEGFGIVAIEASLSGNCVVAANIEGILDAIQDGKNGYLVQSGDAQAFADKLVDITHNPAYYAKQASAFQEYTKEHYAWERIAEEYVDLFYALYRQRFEQAKQAEQAEQTEQTEQVFNK